MKIAFFLISSLFFAPIAIATTSSNTLSTTPQISQLDEGLLTPAQVQKTAKEISVRITSENNGGSGVIIAQKGNTYLILTNAHVVKRATKLEIQAPDGKKYSAKLIDGGFDTKYDLALLQFTSTTKYTLANLSSVAGSPIEPERMIYSAGFPFDSKQMRITTGTVSQLSDIPFDDGTQLGYVTNKGEKGIRQGMSGGAIFDAQGNLLGINTIGVAPILPDYTYNDGSKPLAKLKAQYTRANWGVPIYNFLTHVKPDILYGYANLPKVDHQVTLTGYMAKLNIKARQMTVRIENSGGNGSGVIVAKEGNTYYVLTAKHVFEHPKTQQKYTNHQIITYDQDRRKITSTIVAEGVDLAVVKFESTNNYPVAQLGEYSPRDNDLAFVGGFPGRLNINSPLWQWQLNPGYINDPEQGKFQAQNSQSFSNGYDLIYSSISYGGMSGGPVFDTAGNVIGIHGMAESTNLNSLGISIQTFTRLLAKLRVEPKLVKIVKTNPAELNSVDRKNVFSAMENIPQPQVRDDGNRWLNYANQLYRTRQLDQAILAFDVAITKNQKLFGNYGKALLLWNKKKYQLAESAIAQAIVAVPPNQKSEYYYLWKQQSVILRSLEKYDPALQSVETAITLQKKSLNRLELQDLTLLNQKALILIDKKQYQAAIYIYDESIRQYPESYTYVNRGNTKGALGNYREAIIDFDRAIALNPKIALAYMNRGNAHHALGNNRDALIDYDRAIVLNPESGMAYYNRGVVRFKSGNKEGAMSDFRRAVTLKYKPAQAYYNQGIILLDMGRKEGAILDFRLAIAVDSKFAAAYYKKGFTEYELGNKQDAIADIRRAAELYRQQDKIADYKEAMDLLKQWQGN